jgi:hypothetical protein
MSDLLFSNHAGWFTIPAIIGTIFFVIRMIMLSLGAHVGDVDAHGGFDHPGGHHSDSDDAFQIISVQSIAAFMMGFGWGGLGGLKGAGWDWTASLICGVIAGVAMVWLLGMLLRAAFELQSSGNVRIDSTLGAEGEVYVTVPQRGSGRGQVRLVLNDRQRIFNAVSDGQCLPTQSRIRVVRVNEDNTLTVASA